MFTFVDYYICYTNGDISCKISFISHTTDEATSKSFKIHQSQLLVQFYPFIFGVTWKKKRSNILDL